MEKRTKNLPKRKSTRLPGYDYSSDGTYVVTICVRDHECLFGTITQGKNELTLFGEQVKEIWKKIPSQFENILLDEYIVMPNHVHGTVVIKNNIGKPVIEMEQPDQSEWLAFERGGVTGKFNPMLYKNSLPTILRWFKGRCTYEIRKMENGQCFHWQSRYYDQIIFHTKASNKIRKYIRNNPKEWEKDQFNPINILNKNH